MTDDDDAGLGRLLEQRAQGGVVDDVPFDRQARVCLPHRSQAPVQPGHGLGGQLGTARRRPVHPVRVLHDLAPGVQRGEPRAEAHRERGPQVQRVVVGHPVGADEDRPAPRRRQQGRGAADHRHRALRRLDERQRSRAGEHAGLRSLAVAAEDDQSGTVGRRDQLVHGRSGDDTALDLVDADALDGVVQLTQPRRVRRPFLGPAGDPRGPDAPEHATPTPPPRPTRRRGAPSPSRPHRRRSVAGAARRRSNSPRTCRGSCPGRVGHSSDLGSCGRCRVAPDDDDGAGRMQDALQSHRPEAGARDPTAAAVPDHE